MVKKWFLALCLVAALVGVSACSGGGDSGDGDKSGQSQSQSQAQASKPDLKDIPKVVAEVNGQKISKDEFVQAYKSRYQQMAMQAKMSGQQPDQDALKKQVAKSLVGTELLSQEADKRGYEASKKDVNKSLSDLAKQNGMQSPKQFLKALKKQGLSRDQVISDVKTQVEIDRLIDKKAGDTEPSKQELKALYKQMKAQQKQAGKQGKGSKVPSFEQMKPQLEQQLESQKRSQAAQALVSSLRKDADIKINL